MLREIARQGLRVAERRAPASAQRVLRSAVTQYYRLHVWRHTVAGIDPTALSWVDPERITAVTGTAELRTRPSRNVDGDLRFSPASAGWTTGEDVPWGTVRGGDWDRETAPFADLRFHRAAVRHFDHDVPWAETGWYRINCERIDAGIRTVGTTRTALDGYCDSLDALYRSLREEGYKTQAELGNPYRPDQEVIVNLARDGSIQFSGGGRSRLSLAKVLGLDAIPVVTLVRHADLVYPNGDRVTVDGIRD